MSLSIIFYNDSLIESEFLDLIYYSINIFELRDAKNIHYLDANMLSSCSMVEYLLAKQEKKKKHMNLNGF